MRTMRFQAAFVAMACVLLMGASARAQLDDARLTAPHIDDTTVLVVKVETASLDARPMVEKLSTLLPELAAPLQQGAGEVQKTLDGFRAAFQDQPVYGVIDIPKIHFDLGVDFREMPGPAPLPLFIHDKYVTVLVPSPTGELPLGKGKDRCTERPEFDAAREAVAEYPLQALIAPPPHFRRTIEEIMPTLPDFVGGGSSRVVTEGFLWAAVGFDPEEVEGVVVIQSENETAATALVERIPVILRNVVIAVNEDRAKWNRPEITEKLVESIVATATPKVEDDRVVLRVGAEQQEMRMLATAFLEASREFDRYLERSDVSNQFKQIALALHNFHDANRHFPPPKDGRDEEGRPRLSWRVHLLPYLEENELYKQFHLDEPWNSEHNMTLIEKMPDIYRTKASRAKAGYTTFLAPVGEKTAFGGTETTKLGSVTDGTSNSIFIVDVKDELAVPWTAPKDYEFDPEDPGKGLRIVDGVFRSAFLDGSCRNIAIEKVDAKLILHLFQISDGNPANIPR